jgi:aminopeptidase N
VTPVVAASGPPVENGEWPTYTLTAGRTFAISASTEFLTASAQVGHVTVTSYYLQKLYQGAAEAALNAAAQAVQIFSQRFGPYPHETLAVVMGDFNDGMEFSALFFHSAGLYNLYDGTMNSLVVAVAAHETAHQWWFEQVANDQALQPWLDEALSAYSEHVFYETASPSSIHQWWWIYRVDLYDPQGWVDIPVYAGEGFQPYTNAVYFRGAHFLADLRERIGDEAFFGFLQAYVKQEYGKIATADDFFELLRQYAPTDFADIERQYFQNVY